MVLLRVAITGRAKRPHTNREALKRWQNGLERGHTDSGPSRAWLCVGASAIGIVLGVRRQVVVLNCLVVW
jgi:hypothetical protein